MALLPSGYAFMRIFEMLRQDAATAVRMLRRSSGFVTAAVATLALGIGANTAIFSLINATLLEPLPYPHADRIVQLWLTAPNGGGLTLSIRKSTFWRNKRTHSSTSQRTISADRVSISPESASPNK